MKTIFLTLGMSFALVSSSCKKSESEWVTAEIDSSCCGTYLKIDNSYYKVCEGKELLPQTSKRATIQYLVLSSCLSSEMVCAYAGCIGDYKIIKITAVK